MKKLIAVLCFALSSTCWAGDGAKQFQNTLDLGAGYSIPTVSNSAEKSLGEVKFGAELPRGLDCSGIDWKGQLTQNLQADISMNDLELLGQNALAASASYLAASFRPTWYETYQQAVKQAKLKLASSQNDCRAIETALKSSDPVGLYDDQKKAEKTQEAVAAGVPWDSAISSGAESTTNWRLSKTIDKTNMDPDNKAALMAMLGDIWFSSGGGERNTGGDTASADDVEQVFQLARPDVANAVEKRLTGQDDCSKPLFSSEEDQAEIKSMSEAVQKALEEAREDPKAAPKFDRKLAIKSEIKRQLSIRPEPALTCSGVKVWKKYDAEDRAVIMQLYTDSRTLRGLGLALRQSKIDMENLKRQHPDQAEVLDRMSPLNQLETAYADLKTGIEERRQLQTALIRANQRARIAEAGLANERLNSQRKNEYKRAATPPSILSNQ